ncbi:MAG: hypothetical protein BGN88_04620 [Clostridiales bacterium 43-6]|nr:MAG: hypothetical protein BGN88_04620 [Clostridiales bacterium 43-6]
MNEYDSNELNQEDQKAQQQPLGESEILPAGKETPETPETEFQPIQEGANEPAGETFYPYHQSPDMGYYDSGYYNNGYQPQPQPAYQEPLYPPQPQPVSEFHSEEPQQTNEPEIQEKPKSNMTGLRVFCAIMALVVFTSIGASVGYLVGVKNDGVTSGVGGKIDFSQQETPTVADVKPDASGKYTTAQVARIVSPSVVFIYVYTEGNKTTNTQPVGGQASGIIMDKNGYILTNDHIYSEVPNAKFLVALSDGRELDADFVAGDSRSDLAVLKIRNPSNLTPAVFGNSDALQVGDDVIAIGSPDGLDDTVTKGIVSAVNRRVTGGSQNQTKYSMKCIQTDTAINPGNSGGALVNMYGQVIGVNSSKIVDETVEGIGFAIPIKAAKTIADSLVKNGYIINRGRLGITYQMVDTLSSRIYKDEIGLKISEIALDSDLNNRGISKGDTIKKIDGKEITNSDMVLDIIESKKPSETVILDIYVATTKQIKTVTVKLLADKGSSSYNSTQQGTTLNKNNPFGQ